MVYQIMLTVFKMSAVARLEQLLRGDFDGCCDVANIRRSYSDHPESDRNL